MPEELERGRYSRCDIAGYSVPTGADEEATVRDPKRIKQSFYR